MPPKPDPTHEIVVETKSRIPPSRRARETELNREYANRSKTGGWLVAGCLLLWLNLRPRRDQVIIAKSKPVARRPKLSVEISPVAREMQNNEPAPPLPN